MLIGNHCSKSLKCKQTCTAMEDTLDIDGSGENDDDNDYDCNDDFFFDNSFKKNYCEYFTYFDLLKFIRQNIFCNNRPIDSESLQLL